MNKALPCGLLVELIEAVTCHEHGSEDNESAITDIQECDMTIIEWLCRLVPQGALDALRQNAGRPLWGDGAPDPSEIIGAAKAAGL